MKKWTVEFERVSYYEVEVEAKTKELAEELASSLVGEDRAPYFVEHGPVECVVVAEQIDHAREITS